MCFSQCKRTVSGKDYKKPGCDWAFKATLSASRCTHTRWPPARSPCHFSFDSPCALASVDGTGWVTVELHLCPATGVCLDKCSRLVIIWRKKLRMLKHEWNLESCKNKHDAFTQTPACCLLDECSRKLEQQKSVLAVPVITAHTFFAPKTCILSYYQEKCFVGVSLGPVS